MFTEKQMQSKVEIPQNQDNSSSSSSSDNAQISEEESPNEVNANLFCQQNFLFLFDSEMNFSKRQGFQANDTDLTPDDFMQMRRINR